MGVVISGLRVRFRTRTAFTTRLRRRDGAHVSSASSANPFLLLNHLIRHGPCDGMHVSAEASHSDRAFFGDGGSVLVGHILAQLCAAFRSVAYQTGPNNKVPSLQKALVTLSTCCVLMPPD